MEGKCRKLFSHKSLKAGRVLKGGTIPVFPVIIGSLRRLLLMIGLDKKDTLFYFITASLLLLGYDGNDSLLPKLVKNT